jgi:diguanylate cyclase (GGDEF)-like protein/PAS domain S-box-containing protein
VLDDILANSNEAIRVVDRDGIVRVWNAASVELYGWDHSEAVGRPQLSVTPATLQDAQQLLASVLSGRSVYDLALSRRDKSGRQLAVVVTAVPVHDELGRVHGVLELSRAALGASAASVDSRQIRVDPITGFESRSWFFERVADYISSSRNVAGFVRLELIDLEAISDDVGYAAGDELAAQFVERIRGVLRDADFVARFGGNEFALFMPGVDQRGIRMIVTRIFATLGEPFLVGTRSFELRAWAGGVICDESVRVGELMRAAGSALQGAKRSGDGGLVIFDDRERSEILERVRLEADFRAGSAEGNVALEYQPIVDTSTGSVASVEALVRWNHPELGPLDPAQFLPAAETTGEILALGRWILREACRQLGEWHGQFPDQSLLVMSVNLSAAQLRDSTLAVEVANALGESAIEPGDLQLEVPQSVLSDDGVLEALRGVSELGVRLAIDDFGIGSSSLSVLRNLPFATIKIAQSVVAGLDTSTEDRAIALSVVTLAEHLGLSCVGVGVETTEQFDFLTYHGCDRAQGFFISRPLSASAMTAVLADPDLLG